MNIYLLVRFVFAFSLANAREWQIKRCTMGIYAQDVDEDDDDDVCCSFGRESSVSSPYRSEVEGYCARYYVCTHIDRSASPFVVVVERRPYIVDVVFFSKKIWFASVVCHLPACARVRLPVCKHSQQFVGIVILQKIDDDRPASDQCTSSTRQESLASVCRVWQRNGECIHSLPSLLRLFQAVAIRTHHQFYSHFVSNRFDGTLRPDRLSDVCDDNHILISTNCIGIKSQTKANAVIAFGSFTTLVCVCVCVCLPVRVWI